MERKQFTFYQSFWVAMESLPKGSRLAFIEAVCAYALDGETRPLTGSAASAFTLAMPILDAARRKAESGKLGGERPRAKRKQTESKTEADAEQTESKDKNKDKDKDKDKDKIKTKNKCSPSDDGDPPAPQAGGQAGVVVAVVRAVGELRPKARKELAGFLRDMDADCVYRALDAAQDAGKPNWAYVRGVLRRKQEQGVHSIQDWDRLERQWERQRQTPASGTPKNVQPDPERADRNAAWLANFVAEQERANQASQPVPEAGGCGL